MNIEENKINDFWVKNCIITGVNSFMSKKGNEMRQLHYLTENGNTQSLFLSNDFDLTKLANVKKFGLNRVSIKIEGSYISVQDIEVVDSK